MKVGDLVRYQGSKSMLIVVKLRKSKSSERGAEMIRCWCPHLSEYYWFYPDTLEVISDEKG